MLHNRAGRGLPIRSWLVALFFSALIPLEGSAGFIAAPIYSAGNSPTSVAVGDFNGDGIPDIIVANYDSNAVSVLLGRGDGTFQQAHDYAAGVSPVSVAVGDFNGDGHLDCVVVSAGTYPDLQGTVTVLLGNGDGSFQDPVSFGAGTNSSSVAVGDFNGDGHLDLAVANFIDNNTVSILLGRGDGTFQAAHPFDAGFYPGAVAVADFNGDGVLDLALANGGYAITSSLTVLLGRGDGPP